MTSPASGGSAPVSGGISQLISNWKQTESAYHSINAWYKQEILNLWDQVKAGTMPPGVALWMFQTQCMPAATQSCEDQMQTESDALNIATSLRNDVTNAQNDYNTLLADLEKGASIGPATPNAPAKGPQAASQLNSALNKLSHDLHIPGMSQIMGASNIKTLSGFIAAIRTNLSGGPVVISHIKHSAMVWDKGMTWVCENFGCDPAYGHRSVWSTQVTHGGMYGGLRSAYNAATKNGEAVPPQFTQITSAFNNLNQSVSGISSGIQAQMQYLNQNLQQYFGIYKSFFDSYSQLSAYIINKSNGG